MTEQPFLVELDGFSGPLDLLLALARDHRIDLARISVLALAEQYLAYLEQARLAHLEVAAEYLVMAAWLTYLKSQLLLPVAERDEPDAEALADALAERLRRLEALRRASAALAARPLLGGERLPRGMPEPLPVERIAVFRAGLGALFAAYGAVMQRGRMPVMRVPPRPAMSLDAALERLSRLLTGHEWHDLAAYLPAGFAGFERRSALAASLVASLELARSGQIDITQAAPFAPVMIRRRG